MATKKRIYDLPVLSSEFRSVRVEARPNCYALIFEYKDETGVMTTRQIEFTGVRAYRHRAEVHCTKWHVEDVYDALAQVDDSEWVADVRGETAKGWEDYWTLNHYMIYLDSVGSFEVLADEWRVLS